MNKFKLSLQDSFNELYHKVSWPTWNDLQASASIVMVAALIIALIVLGMDSSFKFIMENLYKLSA